jgi:hypothetical protein
MVPCHLWSVDHAFHKNILSSTLLQVRMSTYVVYIDDNFHFLNEKSRVRLGEFGTCEEAVAACKGIVEEFFSKLENKHPFKELWEGYTMFGEDPFIETDDVNCTFSAWGYAKQRCKDLSMEE